MLRNIHKRGKLKKKEKNRVVSLSRQEIMGSSSQVQELALDSISNHSLIATGGKGKDINPDKNKLVDVVVKVESFISYILYCQQIRKVMS